ncbi:hypothetical protein HOV30_gp128 [Erwinia phage Derbicus]|uniref:Uncharacterized protein n=2 Tax=Derbicusvirus derbicus TaxID=2734104 RepID=A0A482IKY6_9CAUD|nr:hypothetical protein BIZ82_gp128 [Erwinia phage vB_EamM_EarlPhillipIV]YP_009821172.1 hypothetical protein HOV30_gp128 [Erwinia phage Derbicus]ANZ48977.1 hypothetical protein EARLPHILLIPIV_128 [Erwinia phage vB_EamM_EarlPhillipIV]QBP07554.1 hypothetical protein DERBICUS_128 [Erwinia phage Derbicus]
MRTVKLLIKAGAYTVGSAAVAVGSAFCVYLLSYYVIV